jgi:Matrixin/IPT/TIG domain
MKILHTVLATSGLVAAALAVSALSAPVDTAAFDTLGGSLGQGQRDFRVFNNFSDASANNNTTPHANFPGATGAIMAIWKGHVEWGSEPYAGNGLGDGVSSNPILGSGGANFDNIFQSTHTSAGGSNGNVHSELAGGGGSTLAFTLTPISDGWQIQYYSSWTWQDGPGSVTGGIDLQGVACHEIGHSLGLDHTNVPGSTMLPSISGSGVGQRSIGDDDAAGVQFIYGVKSGTKPHISSLGGSLQIGQTLVINGSNFTIGGSLNEVWFTKMNSDGTPTKVSNVNSVNGTSLSVTIPANAKDGEVMVKNSGTGHANLSNAFPIDLGAGGGDPPNLVSLNPNQGPFGGFQDVTLTGTGFNGTTSVKFGANEAISFVVNSAVSITATTPPGALLSAVDVTVTDGDGASTLPQAYIYFFNDPINVNTVDPSSGPAAGGTVVTVSGPSAVGITSVEFDGVPGTDVEVISKNEVVATTPAHAAGTVDVTVNGGAITLNNAFTYVNAGSFINIGPGLAGSLGVPTLNGQGDLTPGGSGFTLDVASANPSSFAPMFISLFQASAPFKGGTFYPLPILLQINLFTDVFGQFSLPAVIPPGTPPGTSFVVQVWISDVGAIKGSAATNGLKVITP